MARLSLYNDASGSAGGNPGAALSPPRATSRKRVPSAFGLDLVEARKSVRAEVNPIEEANMPSSTTALAVYFRSQSAWRNAKAEEYPEDLRNQQSARALASLSEYVESGAAEERSPGIDEALDAHIPDIGAAVGGAVTQHKVSRYGFGYEATSPSQHGEFLEELWCASMEDAYEFAGEHGEDWTEQLFGFEIDAARDGVYVPVQYWQRRPRSTEAELEATIEAYRGES